MTRSATSNEVDEVVAEILDLVKRVEGSKILELTGDQLSALSLKLSAYKVFLGEHVALARYEKDSADSHYVVEREKIYQQARKSNLSQGDADARKRVESADLLAEANHLSYQHERLRNLYMDCHDVLESIRSRLIQLQTEREET